MRLSAKDVIALRAGSYTATVAPAAGGRLASLAWRCARRTVPLLVAWDGADFDAHDWPKAGAFPMLPFANRLPPEGLAFRRGLIRPQPGPGGFALHGFAHRRPWEVVAASPDRVVMRQKDDGLGAGWPWAWTATQEVQLADCGVTVTIVVRNDSAEPMPLALGWHPYHPAAGEIAPADLHFDARARHDLDARGAAQETGREPAFMMRRGETAAFAGWRRGAQLRTAGGRLEIACDGADYLVVHRPPAADYLCVEPVTSLPGRLAFAPPLAPGGTRSLAWSCGFRSSLPPE